MSDITHDQKKQVIDAILAAARNICHAAIDADAPTDSPTDLVGVALVMIDEAIDARRTANAPTPGPRPGPTRPEPAAEPSRVLDLASARAPRTLH